uniref:DUF456 family protein n=1 Tax=Conchiformibius kuhniae TaxID=211502 RepID=A0A8T9N0U8_9NEIS|nr:DUF456 family protein [Conchiformibius kuhniae]
MSPVCSARNTRAQANRLCGARLSAGLRASFSASRGCCWVPLIGAAVGEFAAKRDLLKAGKVGIGTFAGFIVGTAAKIGAALVILLTVAAEYILYWF